MRWVGSLGTTRVEGIVPHLLFGDWLRPLALWDQFAERLGPFSIKDDFCIEISVINLAHELAANATRRQDVKLSGLMIAPNRDHVANAVFAICEHRGHCTSFGAQPPAGRVDTDAHIAVSLAGYHHGTDVTEQATACGLIGSD